MTGLPPFLLLPLAALLAGCGSLQSAPRDPEGSTERILSTHVIRAGAAENPPWVRIRDGRPGGIEPAIVAAFARSLGARVEWTVNGETPLAERLESQQLDLLASGATSKSPWSKKLGRSRPYSTVEGKRILFAATGENQLLLRLDRFLAAHKGEIDALVTSEAAK